MRVFLKLTTLLGYGSPKQMAGRRSFVLYGQVCAVKPDQDRTFWQDGEFGPARSSSRLSITDVTILSECHLPPTFQSWFTVTNLHIWLLTVRLRALPPEQGKYFIQALVDHFFLDVEDRIRAVLQPSAKPTIPYTFHSSFYKNPSVPSDLPTEDDKPRFKSRAPDRVVTRQMKIFKEQWAGLGLSFDLGLVKGDMELAGAVWRNLLGARGAQGIAFADPSSSQVQPRKFRRSVNLVGGEVVNAAKIDLEKEEATDDGSGVHDFFPEQADLYLAYPELTLDVVRYVRKELVRLERLSDEQIIGGQLDKIMFGNVHNCQ
jgi:cytochrome b pre-mRNA-processing protein 3